MKERMITISQARRLGAALAVLVAGLALYACGADDDSGAGAGNPDSVATSAEFDRELADAPPKLAAVYEQGDTLLDGGLDAFEERLDQLEGHPVVVNKWASWCGPCRFEFPFFQSQVLERGSEVAFLGVNSEDDPDAAETFMEELPLPYPSYVDDASEIADSFKGYQWPSTAFYSSKGELVHTRPGGYASEEDLAADIERYAR
jgi:thiol-disulfide isomerase/thioredoxin